MDNLTKYLVDAKFNVDIDSKSSDYVGTLTCDQECYIEYHYQDTNNTTITNHNKYLELSYNNKSFVKYGIKMTKYNLRKIFIIPIKQYRAGTRNRNGLQICIVHENEKVQDKFLIVAINLQSGRQNDNNQEAYKFVDTVSRNIPTRRQKRKQVKTGKWNVEEFIPEMNRNYYTYINPLEDNINWLLYQTPINVPNRLQQEFKKLLPDSKSLFQNKVPNNPSLFYVYYTQVQPTQEQLDKLKAQKQIEQKAAQEQAGVCPTKDQKTCIGASDQNKDQKDDKKDDKDDKDNENKKDDKTDDEEDEEEEDEIHTHRTWWQEMLVIIGSIFGFIIVFLLLCFLIMFLIYYFVGPEWFLGTLGLLSNVNLTELNKLNINQNVGFMDLIKIILQNLKNIKITITAQPTKTSSVPLQNMSQPQEQIQPPEPQVVQPVQPSEPQVEQQVNSGRNRNRNRNRNKIENYSLKKTTLSPGA